MSLQEWNSSCVIVLHSLFKLQEIRVKYYQFPGESIDDVNDTII